MKIILVLGNGIKYGSKYADTEIVGWMHSDLEYDINILDKVLEVININNDQILMLF